MTVRTIRAVTLRAVQTMSSLLSSPPWPDSAGILGRKASHDRSDDHGGDAEDGTCDEVTARIAPTPHLELGTADLARLAMLTNYGSSLMLIAENYTNGNVPTV